jgi:hypothetical protein
MVVFEGIADEILRAAGGRVRPTDRERGRATGQIQAAAGQVRLSPDSGA